jgi:hypothetical protein
MAVRPRDGLSPAALNAEIGDPSLRRGLNAGERRMVEISASDPRPWHDA